LSRAPCCPSTQRITLLTAVALGDVAAIALCPTASKLMAARKKPHDRDQLRFCGLESSEEGCARHGVIGSAPIEQHKDCAVPQFQDWAHMRYQCMRLQRVLKRSFPRAHGSSIVRSGRPARGVAYAAIAAQRSKQGHPNGRSHKRRCILQRGHGTLQLHYQIQGLMRDPHWPCNKPS